MCGAEWRPGARTVKVGAKQSHCKTQWVCIVCIHIVVIESSEREHGGVEGAVVVRRGAVVVWSDSASGMLHSNHCGTGVAQAPHAGYCAGAEGAARGSAGAWDSPQHCAWAQSCDGGVAAWSAQGTARGAQNPPALFPEPSWWHQWCLPHLGALAAAWPTQHKDDLQANMRMVSERVHGLMDGLHPCHARVPCQVRSACTSSMSPAHLSASWVGASWTS